MMKLLRWIPYYVVVLSLLSACDNTIPKLPPETQSGNNTFGCLINGELVVADANTNPFLSYRKEPKAWFNYTRDTLLIRGDGQNNQLFTFWIVNPTEESTIIDSLEYVAPSFRYAIRVGKVSGIQFTRLDTEMGVVSGTFAFQLDTLKQPADSPLLNVTLGRFDIKMDY